MSDSRHVLQSNITCIKTWVNLKQTKNIQSAHLESGVAFCQPGLILTVVVKLQTEKILYNFGLVLVFSYSIITKLPCKFLAVVHSSEGALWVFNDTAFDGRSHNNDFAFYLKEKRSIPTIMLQKCYVKCWASPKGACTSANWWKHLSMESIKHGNKTYLLYTNNVLLKNKNKNKKTRVSVNSSMT